MLVRGDEIRAAQIITLATLALWLAVGYVPPLQRYVSLVRAALLAAYLVGSAAFVAFVYFRP
jgi:hypothetical protein